ncbi:hypothetical protein Taro_024485 [Colocasia esculenta]|uniref:Mitochondrial pyruvate carrier n=1 Tax=Colocasia esculenta TaxID=4460 RepID=A0A843V7K0_COLES|nr:hypothetical protein [Colocasia esculenta]
MSFTPSWVQHDLWVLAHLPPLQPLNHEDTYCIVGIRGFLSCSIITVHFWAPTFKWGISIANIADFAKPPEKLSYPQQVAVTCTGVIWSRYSTVITPKNWNLFSVNVAMAGTGLYQLSRKIRYVPSFF